MIRKQGRPKKYVKFLESLDNQEVYSPASIVDHGISIGLFFKSSRTARRRARHSFRQLALNHGFPREGDGWVIRKGQRPAIGYLGKRWKEAI